MGWCVGLFVSGLVMMYERMPSLSPEERLRRLPALDLSKLEVAPAEPVVSQRVTVTDVALAGARLELLQADDADSPVGRFLGRRGPGLHHITLAVDDLSATLARLRARGVRLIDETPRTGAGGSRIAFIHPSSAEGVLVELKESTPG